MFVLLYLTSKIIISPLSFLNIFLYFILFNIFPVLKILDSFPGMEFFMLRFISFLHSKHTIFLESEFRSDILTKILVYSKKYFVLFVFIIGKQFHILHVHLSEEMENLYPSLQFRKVILNRVVIKKSKTSWNSHEK